MKKKKTLKTKKSKKVNYSYILIGLAILGGSVIIVLKNLMTSSTINMIAPSQIVPSRCGIADIKYSGTCSGTSFKSVSVKCVDGKSQVFEGGTSCKDISGWYTEASNFCQNSCLASPSPSISPSPRITLFSAAPSAVPSSMSPTPMPSIQPSLIPSPVPSSIPSPQVCAQETGICVSSATRVCTAYTDSCQRASICAVPYEACHMQQKR